MSDFEKFYVEYADERFTRDEMKAIYDGMDKDDYTEYGKDRYQDLERIKTEILNEKGERVLSVVNILKVFEILPPKTKYKYFYGNTTKQDAKFECFCEFCDGVNLSKILDKNELRLIYNVSTEKYNIYDNIEKVEKMKQKIGKRLVYSEMIEDEFAIPNLQLKFKFA